MSITSEHVACEAQQQNDREKKDIAIKKHLKYFQRCMDVLPSQCENLDTSRMTLLFFCLSGMDVLNCLNISPSRRYEIIEWIYSQQVLPDPNNPENNSDRCGGFRGSSFLGVPFNNSEIFTTLCEYFFSKAFVLESPQQYPYDCSHIAMTYTGLASLLILGDDFSRINKPALMKGLQALQQPDGSFCSTIEGTETDMRFVYCACSVCYMLNDWSGVNKDKASEYIRNSVSYDFGIAQGPNLESHGGSTFCAIASLVLMERLHMTFSNKDIERIKKWCINRQQSGFQGRPNKPVDTCYSFWVGASVELLGSSELIDRDLNTAFILSTEGQYTGGFSKWPDAHPDPLHSYLGLCGLSLIGHHQVEPIHAALNITQRATEWMKSLFSR